VENADPIDASWSLLRAHPRRDQKTDCNNRNEGASIQLDDLA
jgi:hypothetical protein